MTGEKLGGWGEYRRLGRLNVAGEIISGGEKPKVGRLECFLLPSHLRAASFGLISLTLGSHCLKTCNQEINLINMKNQIPYNIWKCHVVIALQMLCDRRSPKGQGLLRKEGPPMGPPSNMRYFVAKLSIIAIYVPFERLS